LSRVDIGVSVPLVLAHYMYLVLLSILVVYNILAQIVATSFATYLLLFLQQTTFCFDLNK